MKKLTGEQILDLIQEKEISWEQLGYRYVDWSKYPKFGEVTVVDNYGGENMGSKYYVVYYFVKHDVYIRIDGYYQSYNGAEFDEPPYEVKPVQKTITIYEA